MENSKETIECQNSHCRQKLRVPSDRGRILVTCPRCKTSWTWPIQESHEQVTDEPIIKPTPDFASRRGVVIALVICSVVLIGCGLEYKAWVPTLLFFVSLVTWLTCRRRIRRNQEQTFIQKGAGVLVGATASLSGAASMGFGFVLAFLTLLNNYPKVTPSHFPGWLLTLENSLVTINAWFQHPNTKTVMTVVYLSLILGSLIIGLTLRRYGTEWRPVQRLSKWKQRLTKSLVALQVVTFFTFFSQGPIDAHVAKLAEQWRWRYGVATRAIQDFQAKQLIAEKLTEAATEQKKDNKQEVDLFLEQLAKYRSLLPTPAKPSEYVLPTSFPRPSPIDPSGFPGGWRPDSWPKPPDDILGRTYVGDSLRRSDFKPSRPAKNLPKLLSGLAPEVRSQWLAKADALVTTEVDLAKPDTAADTPAADEILSNPSEGMVWPLKTSEDWRRAKEQVISEEQKADLAERRYGEAVQAALEAVSEYLGLQVSTDPILGGWIDLTISNLTDRVYGHFFSAEPGRRSRLGSHLKRLLTPREVSAEKLVYDIKSRTESLDFNRAEQLINDLRKLPKTSGYKLVDSLAEEVSFQKVNRTNSVGHTWDEKIRTSTEYLAHNAGTPRARLVQQWLEEAKAQKIESQKPLMIIYYGADCPLSKHFREETFNDFEVSLEKARFRSEYRRVPRYGLPPPGYELIPAHERTLPIILFKDNVGNVLSSIGGLRALDTVRLLEKMRAVH